ncbi:hypothetical protein DPMN_025892 [Dreissena polymorpha]|uniref:Uncharacterized protein n=1 Tax=Dreissena polymorpha TaxID=45954 RepID=A0A9D4LSE8_DREPO|nr:hypothetical protein DPMN_025892 [Dreissena polymorpha]
MPTFTVLAYPPPFLFEWRRLIGGEWVTLYKMSSVNSFVSDAKTQTNLYIAHLESSDSGPYMAIVHNELGSIEQEFHIKTVDIYIS